MSGILAGLGSLGGIIGAVGEVIDDLHTSDEERAAGELETRKLEQQLQIGQQEINKEEAKHASLLVAGWRPALGWVCAQALWFYYVPRAALMSMIWAYAAFKTVAGWDGVGVMPPLPPFPEMGIADILGLVGTLLGSATLRHRETMSGKARAEPLTPFQNPFKKAPQSPAHPEAP